MQRIPPFEQFGVGTCTYTQSLFETALKSSERKKESERGRDVQHTCWENMSQNAVQTLYHEAVWNTGTKEKKQVWFTECLLWIEHTARVCFSWGCAGSGVESSSYIQSALRDKQTAEEDMHHIWIAYIRCGVRLECDACRTNSVYFMETAS